VAEVAMDWPEACGAEVVFLGRTRRETHEKFGALVRLEYEAYGPMAEKELETIAARLASEHPEARVLFAHRVGSLAIGEVAVAVVASAPHRGEAFAACRAAIEAIKATVPIWKKEIGPEGVTWVDPCGERAPDPV
jgi:molybdopterin synthase catalytic subunit